MLLFLLFLLVLVGNATSKDIIKLIKHTQKTIKEKFNEDLELEVIIL